MLVKPESVKTYIKNNLCGQTSELIIIEIIQHNKLFQGNIGNFCINIVSKMRSLRRAGELYSLFSEVNIKT